MLDDDIYALMDELADTVGGALWAPMQLALLLALLAAGAYGKLVTYYLKPDGAAGACSAGVFAAGGLFEHTQFQ